MAPVRSLLIVVNVLRLLDQSRFVPKQIAEPGQATSGACWAGVLHYTEGLQYLQYLPVVIEAVMIRATRNGNSSVLIRLKRRFQLLQRDTGPNG